MALTRYEPHKALQSAWEPFTGALAENFRLSDFESPLRSLWDRAFPPVEVREADDHYLVIAELPGFAPEEVDVTVEGDILTISGKREAAAAEDGEAIAYSERLSGTFTRRLTLPKLQAGEVAEARMEHGLLKIRVQKAEEGRRKRITVSAH